MPNHDPVSEMTTNMKGGRVLTILVPLLTLGTILFGWLGPHTHHAVVEEDSQVVQPGGMSVQVKAIRVGQGELPFTFKAMGEVFTLRRSPTSVVSQTSGFVTTVEVVEGQESAKLRRDNYLLPIVVRYPDFIRQDPDWLASLPIADGHGRAIPASVLCRLNSQIAVNELSRENQQPVVSVKANISGRDLGRVAEDLRAKLSPIPLPQGVRLELGGLVESQAKAFQNLLMVLTIATGLVFLLLVIQFQSYRLPLIIFLTLPFAQIDGLWGLRLSGTELNIPTFMGLIMLVGLVVKNGIILIEYAGQIQEQENLTQAEALVRAGRIRLRPILMTSLTAIMALLPLAPNLGAGAELQRPLAITVISGLSLSILFTPIVIPAFALIFRGSLSPQKQEEIEPCII